MCDAILNHDENEINSDMNLIYLRIVIGIRDQMKTIVHSFGNRVIRYSYIGTLYMRSTKVYSFLI